MSHPRFNMTEGIVFISDADWFRERPRRTHRLRWSNPLDTLAMDFKMLGLSRDAQVGLRI